MPLKYMRAEELDEIERLVGERNQASAAKNAGILSADDLVDWRPPQEMRNLNAALERLGEFGRRELATLFWIGRGDWRADQFDEAFEKSYDEGELIHYLRAKVQLAKFARKGLDEVRRAEQA